MRTFGKYRLVEPLASGGMADVWRAEVPLAAGVVKEVALKLIRGEHQARGDFVRMFVEEARLACRLSHANVVQVFEFDQVDGQYYLAMELVRGRHLGLVVERAREVGARMGLPRTVHLVAEAAKALAYVHRVGEGGRPLGLVHRDVSPHNLLLSFEGEVKLADFGIARAMSLAGLTEPGTLKGKIAYMAPEQAAGEPVDARADVFSLGVILWELCAGRRLFARDSDAATLAAVLSGPAPSPPSAWNEAVPGELDAIVLSALEHDAARRTSSAEEMERALSALLLRIARAPQDWDLRSFMHRLWPPGAEPEGRARSEETLVRPPPPGAGAPEPSASPPEERPAAEATAATRTLATGRRRRARRMAAVAVAVAVVGAAGGAALLRSRGAAPAGAPAGEVAPPPPPAARESAAPAPSVPAPEAGQGAAEARPPAPPPEPDGAVAEPETGAPDASPAEGTKHAGVLYVNVTPWARVIIDGRPVGETPLTIALAAGKHRIRAVHPSYGTSETTVEIRAGRRVTWVPSLQRE